MRFWPGRGTRDRVALHRARQADAEWLCRKLQRQAARRMLNEHLFANLNEARQIIEEWRIDYNTNRPHTSLNGLTPTEFATRPDRGQNLNRVYL
ncbi:MAG: integrase core domain-containing protein [Variibacter sp.]